MQSFEKDAKVDCQRTGRQSAYSSNVNRNDAKGIQSFPEIAIEVKSNQRRLCQWWWEHQDQAEFAEGSNFWATRTRYTYLKSNQLHGSQTPKAIYKTHRTIQIVISAIPT
jgi:hypothetical protein